MTVNVQVPKQSLVPQAVTGIGKAAAGVAALSALGELIHQLIRLIGGQ